MSLKASSLIPAPTFCNSFLLMTQGNNKSVTAPCLARAIHLMNLKLADVCLQCSLQYRSAWPHYTPVTVFLPAPQGCAANLNFSKKVQSERQDERRRGPGQVQKRGIWYRDWAKETMTERNGGQEETRGKKTRRERRAGWQKWRRNCQKASRGGKFRGRQGGERESERGRRRRQKEIRMCWGEQKWIKDGGRQIRSESSRGEWGSCWNY